MVRDTIVRPFLPASLFFKGINFSGSGEFKWFPTTGDQLTMLLEGNICESSKVFKLFKVNPISFNEQSLGYLIDS